MGKGFFEFNQDIVEWNHVVWNGHKQKKNKADGDCMVYIE